MTIKGIIFDFDGVLVDSLPAHLQFCREMADELKMQDLEIPTPADFKAGVARSGVAISPMSSFLEAVGFSPDDAEKAQQRYAKEFPKTPLSLFDGVKGMLMEVAHTGAKLGIVSANERRVVETALENVPDLFASSAIVTKSNSPEFSKAQALRTVAQKLECATSELLFIGDQHSDYAAAIEAGVKFLGVTYGWGISIEDSQIPTADRPSDIVAYVRTAEQPRPQLLDALAHAREMFTYYAGQRLTSIRFYLVGLTIALTAWVALVTSDAGTSDTLFGRLAIAFVAIAGLFLTYIFYGLDKRNQMLVESSERLARRMEWLLRLRTGFSEFETLVFTDEIEPKETRYSRLIPHFFFLGFTAFALASIGSFFPPSVTNGDKRGNGNADGSVGDTTSGGSGDTFAFDSWSNELLVPILLVAIVAVVIVVLFVLFRQEKEDKFITGRTPISRLRTAGRGKSRGCWSRVPKRHRVKVKTPEL